MDVQELISVIRNRQLSASEAVTLLREAADIIESCEADYDMEHIWLGPIARRCYRGWSVGNYELFRRLSGGWVVARKNPFSLGVCVCPWL